MKMIQQNNKFGQIFLIFFLLAASWLMMLVTFGLIAAQEESPYPVTLTEQDREGFGLTSELQAAAIQPHNLKVTKLSSAAIITSGETVTFTITIENVGPNEAAYVIFQDTPPSEMQNIQYAFSANAVSNGENPPKWLFEDAIPVNGKVAVTVTGILTSAPHVTITNIAAANSFDPTKEEDSSDNVSAAKVAIYGYNPNVYSYLPVILREPTPTPPSVVLHYHEDFEDNDWATNDSSGCDRRIDSGHHKFYMEAEDGNAECFSPAESEANRKYGEFEVEIYLDDGTPGENPAYGLYINGEGGDEYYILRVWPNEACTGGQGVWEIVRNKDNNISSLSGRVCSPSLIDSGVSGSHLNTVKLVHKVNGLLIAYVNGKELGRVTDLNELGGEGTGIYLKSDANKNVLAIFDDFRVYRYP